jgi:hypothetical protein
LAAAAACLLPWLPSRPWTWQQQQQQQHAAHGSSGSSSGLRGSQDGLHEAWALHTLLLCTHAACRHWRVQQAAEVFSWQRSVAALACLAEHDSTLLWRSAADAAVHFSALQVAQQQRRSVLAAAAHHSVGSL